MIIINSFLPLKKKVTLKNNKTFFVLRGKIFVSAGKKKKCSRRWCVKKCVVLRGQIFGPAGWPRGPKTNIFGEPNFWPRGPKTNIFCEFLLMSSVISDSYQHQMKGAILNIYIVNKVQGKLCLI